MTNTSSETFIGTLHKRSATTWRSRKKKYGYVLVGHVSADARRPQGLLLSVSKQQCAPDVEHSIQPRFCAIFFQHWKQKQKRRDMRLPTWTQSCLCGVDMRLQHNGSAATLWACRCSVQLRYYAAPNTYYPDPESPVNMSRRLFGWRGRFLLLLRLQVSS